MRRIPEPELMNDPAQVAAYAHADFSAPHQAFVDDFGLRFAGFVPHRVLDLGCGSGDVTLRFATAWTGAEIIGVDAAPVMLEAAAALIARAGLTRVHLREVHLPGLPPELADFDTIISNSLLHHLTDPASLWSAVRQAGATGTRVWVRDLRRPDSRGQAEALVAHYAGGESAVLRRDFLNSLLAAYEPDEIRRQLADAGLAMLCVEALGDRHVQVGGVLL